MKKCPRCSIQKQHSNFNKDKRRSDGLQAICRECQALIGRELYHSNHNDRKEKIRYHANKQRNRLQLIVYEYLVNHACIDCGERDPVVLDFDHRNPEDKLMSISSLARRMGSSDILLTEMDKCDIRCANCHRRRTSRQFNWISRTKQLHAPVADIGSASPL